MSQLNINPIAVAIVFALVAMADVHAQTCPTVSSDTTVTSSCDTGITLTGNNNLTIGTPTSGLVQITNTGSSISIGVTGTGNTISNTASGEISAEGGIGIYNDGTIDTLTNSGTISALQGILNSGTGTINTLTNSGTITGLSVYVIENRLRINTLTNSGTITAAGGIGIYNDGIIGTLTNSGTIAAGEGGAGISNFVAGTIGILTNSGTISAGDGGYGINNRGGVTTLTNTGTISVGDDGSGINNFGIITSLNNSGTISAGNEGYGIFNELGGTITTLNNSGTISAEFKGVGIDNRGTISTLINSESIIGAIGVVGIQNSGEGAVITTLTNSGSISVGSGGTGIFNELGGTITTLNNSGSISVSGGAGIDNRFGNITTLNNSGGISAGAGGIGIYNGDDATIDILNNLGTLSAGDSAGVDAAYGIYNRGTITTLTNSGMISAGSNGIGINNDGAIINTINNSGTIFGGTYGIRNVDGNIDLLNNSNSGLIIANSSADNEVAYGVLNTGTINTFNNQGNITAVSTGVEGFAVGVRTTFGGKITSLLNSGVILANTTNTDGVAYGIRIFDSGEISTITNTGSITATSSGVNGIAYGIASIGVINTLNNAQGGNGSSPSTTALTYSGNLPNNYNIILNSATHYGQLAVIDPTNSITNFGIYGAPFITSRTYSSVLSGTALPAGTSSGTYDNMTWALVETGVGTEIFNLTFNGVSLMGTQQSLVNTASALQNTYALQNSVLANSFSYDCPVFGANNVCISAGGRNTAVSAANGLNNTSALLIAAYRIKPTLRIGAYADQNLSVNNAGSTVSLGNSTPLIGLFGVWNQRIDGTGTEVKVAAAFGQKNTTVNRQVVGLSEAGTGSSNLNSQGAQITAKYGLAVAPEVLVSPYVGMRYTQNNMGGYTEGASSSVTAPLTYSALNTNATTALAGVGASYRFIPKATAFASAGVETDTNTSSGTYSATGITGLTPVNFNPNPVKTRPTATLGAYYDIVKNQRIGITGIYRQESYQAVSTTTVLATYTIGL